MKKPKSMTLLSAAALFAIYLFSYNFISSILSNDSIVTRLMMLVGVLSFFFFSSSIKLLRDFHYQDAEPEIKKIESGVMGSYAYSSGQDGKYSIWMLSAFWAGISAYFYGILVAYWADSLY